MSFSYNVKREIAQKFGNARHCNIAELAAIINMCAYIGRFRQKFYIKLQTEKSTSEISSATTNTIYNRHITLITDFFCLR